MRLSTLRANVALLAPAVALAAIGFSGPVAAGEPASNEPTPNTASSVTFNLDGAGTANPPTPVRVSLHCGNQQVVTTALHANRTRARLPIPPATGQPCRIEASTPASGGRTVEIAMEVSAGGLVIERSVGYAGDAGSAVSSKEFDHGGDLTVDLSATALDTDEVGTGLRVLASNIYLGGRLNDRAEPGWDQANRGELVEFLRAHDPDVLFVTETYGAGDLIEDALNENQPAGREFTGVQVTRDDDLGANGDNLWLYTWLPVEEVYPPISGSGISTFNFGGARLGLPDGGHVHAFNAWLYHQDNARVAAHRAVMETLLGMCRTDTDAEVVATDDLRRTDMARAILEDYLPTHVTDDAPVLIGGDFNTFSHLDWDPAFATAPGHEGLSFDWPVTSMFTEAGFVDTFRHVHPDVERYPGQTMDAIHGYFYAPSRIDYIMARGDQVRVLGARTIAERASAHQGSRMADHYPFYADHAAVVTDLVIRGDGPGFEREVVREPDRRLDPWPEPPAGHAVPPGQLTATASTEISTRPADRAVDGDLRTHWATDQTTSGPHTLTVDMGEPRDLTAVRYIPRIDSNFGMVLRGTLQLSADGETFTDVAEFDWDRYNRPADIELDGRSARFVRLRVDHSSAGPMAAAAQLIPYQATPPDPGDEPTVPSEVIVAPTTMHDDCSPAYAETGTWVTSNLAGHDGSQTRYSNEPGATATWIPELPTDGVYAVEIWWPEHSTTTTSATYTVNAADATTDVTIDPREHFGDWHPLGSWRFDEGTAGSVTLTVDSGYHRAAAIRLTRADADGS